jgi:hypothetical protein
MGAEDIGKAPRAAHDWGEPAYVVEAGGRHYINDAG